MIYIRPDLYGHWGLGIFVGLAGLWIGWYALIISAIFAVLKELYDRRHPPHVAEPADFYATMIGCGMALGVILLHKAFP